MEPGDNNINITIRGGCSFLYILFGTTCLFIDWTLLNGCNDEKIKTSVILTMVMCIFFCILENHINYNVKICSLNNFDLYRITWFVRLAAILFNCLAMIQTFDSCFSSSGSKSWIIWFTRITSCFFAIELFISIFGYFCCKNKRDDDTSYRAAN
jgi:hypothetical protein